MDAPTQSATRNRLLALMAPEDFDRLAPHFERMRLPKGHVLVQPEQAIDHVVFMESGVASVLAVSPEGLEVEAGLFGRDGFGPTALLMGAERADHRLVIQVEDDAWRMAKAPFLAAVEASASMRALLLRYVQSLMVQTGYTALSNAVHPIDQRLARWILMCDDRMDGRDMPLTHEFLSVMLACRRPSVTTALHVLEGDGLVRSERGCLIVRDRSGLERYAGDAYGRAEAAYRDLVGPMR